MNIKTWGIISLMITIILLWANLYRYNNRNSSDIFCMDYNEYSTRQRNTKMFNVLDSAVALLEYNNYKYSVVSGTMLHLYRNCTLLHDTPDVDISVPLVDLDERLLAHFYANGWKKLRSFGKQYQDGYEVTLKHVNGEKLDLYGETTYENFSWISVWHNKKDVHMCAFETPTKWYRLYINKNKSYMVHGKPETFFKNVYGLNWRKPVPSSNFNWRNPFCIKK